MERSVQPGEAKLQLMPARRTYSKAKNVRRPRDYEYESDDEMTMDDSEEDFDSDESQDWVMCCIVILCYSKAAHLGIVILSVQLLIIIKQLNVLLQLTESVEILKTILCVPPVWRLYRQVANVFAWMLA